MSVKLRDEGDRKHFVVGEPVCLPHFRRFKDCPDCSRPPPDASGAIRITAIDRAAGKVTFGADE